MNYHYHIYLNPPTYIQQACMLCVLRMRDCSQTFWDSLCDRGRSRDCCFDEINVSDNWWWELITGTIICVWSVYICSPALCPLFRSSPPEVWAAWWAASSPVSSQLSRTFIIFIMITMRPLGLGDSTQRWREQCCASSNRVESCLLVSECKPVCLKRKNYGIARK